MRSFKKVLSAIIICISIMLISSIAKINNDVVYFLAATLVGFIKILGFLVIPLSKYVNISRAYIYLSLYIGGCGIFRIVTSILRAVGIGTEVKEMLFLSFIVSIMEIIAIYHVIDAEESKLENKEIITNVFGFIASFIFISSLVITLPFLKNKLEVYGLETLLQVLEVIYEFRILLQVFVVILFIALIIALQLYCNNIYKIPIKKDLITFIIIRILHSSLCLVITGDKTIFYIKTTLLVLSGIYIGKIFFTCIIKNPSETLYLNLKFKNRDLGKALEELEVYSNLIKNENEYINNIINSFPEAVGIFENSKLIFANIRFSEIFQCYDKEKLIGCSSSDFIRQDYQDQFNRRLEDVGIKSRCEEIEYVLEFNGIEFIGEVVSSKIKKGDENITVCVIRDVTKKRMIEELNSTLESKENESKIRSELLTNVSHEFKTPVHVIYSAIQMQELYSKNGDFKNLLKFNGVIKQNCFRLIRLINNFIDITRFEANYEVKSNIVPANIVNLVENTVESVISYCDDNSISIIFDTDNEEIYGEFDVEMIDRIMLNLLSNAIKYNVDNGDIFVYISENDDEIMINVKDTGVGISKEDLEKLFQRFERFDKSLARKREGSGIGLNIVKSLVEYQNGRIEVSSKLGEGTTFSLIFPKIEVNLEHVTHYDNPKDDLISRVSLELSDII